MGNNKNYNLPAVQARLKKFFSESGVQPDGSNTFQIADLTSWIQLQAVTAIFHGQTFSFTRFMATKAAFTAISPQDTFTVFDSFYYRATSPTIIGAQANRDVMSDNPLSVDGVTDAGLLAVVKGYSTKSAALKQAELQTWQASGNLATQGWIVADFFPEGWDGRQLTINSYI